MTTKVFPASVRGPFGAADQAAVVVEGLRLLVFSQGSGGTPRLIAEATIPDFDPSTASRATWTVTDGDGGEWTVRAGGGCGCSNPLKRYSAEALVAVASMTPAG